MGEPSLFDRVVGALFGGPSTGEAETERQLVADMIEMIVDAVEPRVRLHARYKVKLEACVRTTIAYLRTLGKGALEPLLLTRANWSQDPCVNAFFATADDVRTCQGRSNELRAFFEDPANVGVDTAYGLLGMKKEERTIFAPRFEDGILKQDVAQICVSFSDHRLIAPSAALAQTRLEVGRRIIRRLAQVALRRIVALDEKAVDLEQHKGYLGARLRILHLARDGMEGLVDDPATLGEQIKSVERELKSTVDDYIEAKASLATLDGYLGQIVEVLLQPAEHVQLTQNTLRLNRMGIKVDAASEESANALTLTELSIGDGLHGVIALVECPRAEMPPKEDLIANAERYL